MHRYQNPVLRGYNPDPSIVRVGDDFYLVTSTFEFFPGVPVYHSKNLVNWELINHCLTDEEQLPLKGARNSGGIFAPTIRYHDGVFYMITTNVSSGGNFLVTTRDIRGKWSKPVYIQHRGIDPSLLFDDGKVYFCATSHEGGRSGIAMYELNVETGELLTDARIVSYGIGGKFPEAPHLYRIGGYYYLLLAEGGTEYGHMVTIFRSRDPYGPYESCPHNPILSHKDFQGSPIQATGHADLIEDQHGHWWLVFLGIRPFEHAMLHNLGRETFLAPVSWDADGWPVVGHKGRVSLEMEGPLPLPPQEKAKVFEDGFSGDRLHPAWTFVRNPVMDRYQHADDGTLLRAGEETLADDTPTAVLMRQQEFDISAELDVRLSALPDGAQAGLVVYYNKDYHYEIYLTREQGRCLVELGRSVHDIRAVTARQEIPETQDISFKVEADQKSYTFYYRIQDEWLLLGSGSSAGLCTEGTMSMTFTGTFIGAFAARGAQVLLRRFRCQERSEVISS